MFGLSKKERCIKAIFDEFKVGNSGKLLIRNLRKKGFTLEVIKKALPKAIKEKYSSENRKQFLKAAADWVKEAEKYER